MTCMSSSAHSPEALRASALIDHVYEVHSSIWDEVANQPKVAAIINLLCIIDAADPEEPNLRTYSVSRLGSALGREDMRLREALTTVAACNQLLAFETTRGCLESLGIRAVSQ
jgi:hypothetical protein